MWMMRYPMDEECGVCGGKISVKHESECGHVFCYLCIKRELRIRGRCPVCGKGPYEMSSMMIADGLRKCTRDESKREGRNKCVLKAYELKKHAREVNGNESKGVLGRM